MCKTLADLPVGDGGVRVHGGRHGDDDPVHPGAGAPLRVAHHREKVALGDGDSDLDTQLSHEVDHILQ